VAIALLVDPSSFAKAQSAGVTDSNSGSDTGLTEVVVTAQRREQRLQDVPIAVTAFSAGSLRAVGLNNSDQLAAFTPNLTWNQSGSVGSNVGLRGIVDSNITTNQVASVGILVDEVGLNSPVLNTIPLFDIDRIEVLRGPQVTLYGRSTTAGAININTVRPVIGSGTSGYVDVGYGNLGAINVEAAGTTQLGSRAALRVAVLSQERDGIYFNPTLNRRVAERDRQGVRASVAIEPTDDLTVFANFQYGQDRGGGLYFKSSGQRNPTNPAQSCAPLNSTPGDGICVNDAGLKDSSDFGLVYAGELSVQDIDVVGGLLNVSYDFGSTKLTSITSHLENDFRLKYDVDGGPLNRGVINNDTLTGQFSQELRLASDDGADAAINWIAGLYYFRERQDGLYILAIRDNAVAGSPPGSQLRSFMWDQENEIRSGYAQVDWRFAPGWELSLGGRYSDESKSGVGTTRWSVNPGFFATNPDVPVAGAPTWNAIRANYPPGVFFTRELIETNFPANLRAESPFDRSWKNSGGKLGISWKRDENSLLYANYSKGFKGGTFNLLPAVRLTNPATAAAFRAGVRPEKVTTYEVGGKFDLADRTLRLNVALFRNDYSDQQQTVFDAGSSALVLANAASATIDGAELELEWRPVRGMLLQAGIGYLDAAYGNFIATPGNPLADFSGQQVIQSSKFNANVLVRQSWDVGDGLFSVQGSMKRFTSFAYVAENSSVGQYSPVVRAPASSLFDARLVYEFGSSGKYELSLWGKNLGDERFCTTNGSTPFGSGQCGPNEPRTYGASLRLSFE